jgi:hypothetical protein
MEPDSSLSCTKACHPYPEPVEYSSLSPVLSRYARHHYHPSAPRASMWPLAFRHAHLNTRACHMSRPYHPSFDSLRGLTIN